jgi:tetratricopeptide (TPR) repeat protein
MAVGAPHVLEQARELMSELRFEEARQLLSNAIAEARGVHGSTIEQFRAFANGMLGESCFQMGDATAAIEPTTAALRLCEEQGDQPGVVAYLENLVEIHRYLGQAEPAATAADRCAEVLSAAGRERPAAQWRRQAQVMRAGEPLNRVMVLLGDDRYELDDLPAGEMEGGFTFQRNRVTLAPAQQRTSAGERLGGQGRQAEAYRSFQEAARLDRFDPHSRYLSGLALLFLRRYAEAVTEYEATERLAPGWFQCRADLWMARELARGALDHELFVTAYQLQNAPLPPAEKVRQAEAALQAAPGLAPLYLYQGDGLAALGATADAEAAYRKGLACAGEPDVRTRLLVALGIVSGSAPERAALLDEAAATEGGNLIATAMATIARRPAG